MLYAVRLGYVQHSLNFFEPAVADELREDASRLEPHARLTSLALHRL